MARGRGPPPSRKRTTPRLRTAAAEEHPQQPRPQEGYSRAAPLDRIVQRQVDCPTSSGPIDAAHSASMCLRSARSGAEIFAGCPLKRPGLPFAATGLHSDDPALSGWRESGSELVLSAPPSNTTAGASGPPRATRRSRQAAAGCPSRRTSLDARAGIDLHPGSPTDGDVHSIFACARSSPSGSIRWLPEADRRWGRPRPQREAGPSARRRHFTAAE